MSKKQDGYSKSTLFKKTLPYILKEKKLVIITLLLSLLVAGLTTLTPLITKEILDVFIPSKNSGTLFLLISRSAIFLFIIK